MERVNRLIQYIDKLFWKEKVHINNGSMVDHYDGLTFDYYFDNSIYSIDYIDVYDYFIVRTAIDIEEEKKLWDQVKDLSIDKKVLVIESILNLLNKTTYNKENNDFIIKKVNSVLEQCGFHLVNNDEIKIYLEFVKFNGSYCEIVEISPTCYKKRLQKKYNSIYQWQLRMKREFENLKKLEDSEYVLNAYVYDENEHAFTMEVCESNLADDFEQLDEKQIEYVIHDILYGMNDVHLRGIIHRDLHLGNILRKNNSYVLSDFGLSKDTMINTNYKSSNTPKNSHMFMDPAAKDDFNKLDKLTDIFSVGKIIEYLVASKPYASIYKFIISKATNSDRSKRYQTIAEMINDFEQTIESTTKVKTTQEIISEIINGKYNADTSAFVLKLLKDSSISNFIVQQKLYNFGDIILNFSDDIQYEICKNIERNYVDATGYNGWGNYDIFGEISKHIIENSETYKIRKIAVSILEGCANCRFYYCDVLKKVKVSYPELF